MKYLSKLFLAILIILNFNAKALAQAQQVLQPPAIPSPQIQQQAAPQPQPVPVPPITPVAPIQTQQQIVIPSQPAPAKAATPSHMTAPVSATNSYIASKPEPSNAAPAPVPTSAPAPQATQPKPEEQPLSQVTNKEIFDNFKKNITPVKINEQSEPYKIEYDIPRKSFKKDLSEVSKDLKFKLVEKSDKEDFFHLIQEGYKASLSGQLEASVAIYKKALKVEEKNTNILFALASLYHKLMQYPEARSYYKRLLAIDPNYKKAMNNYLALVSEETPSMALQELLELERANPQYSPVIAQIGMVYAKLGDHAKAESYLKKAVTVSPEVAAYRYNLAVVYDQMNRYMEAMTLYRQVLDTNYTYEILPQSRQAIKERVDYLQTKISIQQPAN